MAFSYSITIYEKDVTTNIYPDMLAETFKLDESLDSAVITIPRSLRKEPFKRFSRVKIVKTDGLSNSITTHWLIFSTKSDIGTKGTTNTFNHTLALIEPTKWLEKFIIGTKTFTQPQDGVQLTLLEAINQIKNLAPFLPKVMQTGTRLFEIDSTFEQELIDSNDKLPQMFFDKKNTREIYFGLFRVINAIPRMYYDSSALKWKLKADYVNKKLLPFEVNYESIDYKSEASGDNFGQTAQVFHENTIPENFDKTIPNVFANSITEYISFRSDDILVGESNLKLILSNKAKEIISLEIFMPQRGFEYDIDLDITPYLYNKKVFDTLDYDTGDGIGSKSHAIYWEYGSNVIDGFNLTYNFLGTEYALGNILDTINYPNDLRPLNRGYTFKVKYIPLIENMRSEQYRIDKDKYSLTDDMYDSMSSIQLNPKERINDLYNLTWQLYGEIQRIGVDTVSFSRKHYNIASFDPDTNTGGIYSLGDYTTDNFIITKVEVLYYRSFAIARYEASRDWNRLAQFIQLDKEYRPYEISLTKTDYNLKRDIMIPLKFVIIDNENIEDDLDTQTTNLKYNFLNTFRAENVTPDGLPYSAAALQINGEGTTELQETATYKPLIVAAEKNTIKYKLNYLDTKLAGKKIEVTYKDFVAETFDIAAIKQIQVPYTLEDGTFQYGKINLFKSYWSEINDSSPIDGSQDILAMQANMLPEITIHNTPNIRNVLSTNIGVYREAYNNGYPLFYDAYIYDSLGDFPTIGIYDAKYLALDTNLLYYYSTLGYLTIGSAWLMESNPDFSTDIYEINKDQSEILGIEMTIPMLPQEELTEMFIVGDMLSRKNVLVIGSNETLYWQTSEYRYSKSSTENVGVDVSRTIVDMAIGESYLSVPSAIYGENNYCIVDSLGNLFLAVNQIGIDGEKTIVDEIYFNFMDIKYIYGLQDIIFQDVYFTNDQTFIAELEDKQAEFSNTQNFSATYLPLILYRFSNTQEFTADYVIILMYKYDISLSNNQEFNVTYSVKQVLDMNVNFSNTQELVATTNIFNVYNQSAIFSTEQEFTANYLINQNAYFANTQEFNATYKLNNIIYSQANFESEQNLTVDSNVNDTYYENADFSTDINNNFNIEYVLLKIVAAPEAEFSNVQGIEDIDYSSGTLSYNWVATTEQYWDIQPTENKATDINPVDPEVSPSVPASTYPIDGFAVRTYDNQIQPTVYYYYRVDETYTEN